MCRTCLQAVIIDIILITLFILPAGCKPVETGPPDTSGPAALPENAAILFLSNRDTGTGRFEIYSMDEDGGSVTRVTNSNEQHFIFGISPSRRNIAATRGTEEQKRIWLLDLETGEERPLTGEKDNAEGRSFSPDGEWLVFWMVPKGEQYSDIYKIKLDGSAPVNLTNTPQANEFDPAFSVGGDRIAFVSNDGQPDRFVLKLMDAEGTNVSTLYDPTDAALTERFPAGVYDPSWGAGDKEILVDKPVRFTGGGENGGAGVWHIFSVDVNDGTARDLTAAGELADSALYLPSFSPDGKRVAASLRQGPEDPSGTTLDIVAMNSDGTGVQKLTGAPWMDQFPVWIK